MLPAHGRVRENGSQALQALADAMSAEVAASAQRLGTRDFAAIAREMFDLGDAQMAAYSSREFAYGNFVRSVLDPVRQLPAAPFDMPAAVG